MEFSLVLLQQQQVPTLLENVSFGSIVLAVLIFTGAWFVIHWSTRIFENLASRSTRGRFLFRRAEPVVRMLVWFYAAYLGLLILAPSRETFLALIASIGLAIGLGAQDLVKNIIGGLIVLVDRPYQLGDRVRIGDAYGEIDHIGLRSTKLTTPDDTRVTIPNSEVLGGKVYNANSGVPDCQVVTDVVAPHNIDPQLAIELGYEAAYSCPFLLLDKPVVVLILDRFEDSPYCIVRVKAYVYDHRAEPKMQSDITARLKSELLRLGILASVPAFGPE
ncbi:MAG: mechanosensitive ion channel [Acidobacteria bacterium]|nr:mechanosensitive ion channel [Acidobacteriota bacterium]